MTDEEIQNMAHEINSMSTDITALMVWIAETIEPLQKENAELKVQIENYKLSENESKEIIAELKEQNKAERENAVTRLFQNQRLEKENAELKEQNENKREEIKMLRNEHKQDMAIHNNYVNKVEELKAQIENYKLSENESKEIIAELKMHCKVVDEVNEKMKNCENCKYGIAYGVCVSTERCRNNDQWELAE